MVDNSVKEEDYGNDDRNEKDDDLVLNKEMWVWRLQYNCGKLH